jgi:hypothetical protein
MPMVATVTMNDGRPSLAVSTPLARPIAAPASSVRTSVGMKPKPARKAWAAAMPATAMIEPMERSISPSRITQVMPKAAMAITAICCSTFIRLATVMKRGFITEKMMQRITRETRMPPYCRSSLA